MQVASCSSETEQMKRFYSSGRLTVPDMWGSSRGGSVIQWEEALDAQLLKRNVLWCAEHRDGREEVIPLFAMPESDWHHGEERCTEISGMRHRGGTPG